MANTLTSLYRDAYSALEIVSREPLGLINAVTKNVTAEREAKDVVVRNPVAPKNSKYTITPSMTPLAAADMVYTNRTLTLNTLEGYKFHFTSEEEMGLKASGPWGTMWQQNIAQGFRALTASLATALAALYYNSARAVGTSGTTPFATDLSLLGAAAQELNRNGAPAGDRQFVCDYKAAYNLSKLTQLVNVNTAGGDGMLRKGALDPLFGFNVASDGAIPSHTAGTSTGQDVTTGQAIGATTVTYDGGSGGTILVGDTIAPASDVSNLAGAASQYVVNTAVTASSGSIVINSPGLLDATTAGEELALGADYRANLAFSRDAFAFAARAPKGGDAAVEEMIVSDPLTGIPFRLARYLGHHMANWEMSILYGVGPGNPEHAIIVKG